MPDLPRSRAQRISDTLDHLERDVDAWFATTDGERPWLVPLCFCWYAGRIVAATESRSRTVRNVTDRPDVRVSLGGTRDVVMVQGRAELTTPGELEPAELALLTAKLESDPAGWADAVLRVVPDRVQAWREENELADRLIMRDGRWLEVEDGVSAGGGR